MSSLDYVFLYFPKNSKRRLTVDQKEKHNEHARYMFKFMEQRREEQRIKTEYYSKAIEIEKRRMKKNGLNQTGSSIESESPQTSCSSGSPTLQLVPNPFYIPTPRPVQLIPNPFYIGSSVSSTSSGSSTSSHSPPLQLVPNPFYQC